MQGGQLSTPCGRHSAVVAGRNAVLTSSTRQGPAKATPQCMPRPGRPSRTSDSSPHITEAI
eukprot:14572425-Heterocapsa_arctica.AAC.1